MNRLAVIALTALLATPALAQPPATSDDETVPVLWCAKNTPYLHISTVPDPDGQSPMPVLVIECLDGNGNDSAGKPGMTILPDFKSKDTP